MEDSNNLASFTGRKLMFEDKLTEPTKILAEIDKVTKNQIVDLAKKLFREEKSNLAIIGPFKKEDFSPISF